MAASSLPAAAGQGLSARGAAGGRARGGGQAPDEGREACGGRASEGRGTCTGREAGQWGTSASWMPSEGNSEPVLGKEHEGRTRRRRSWGTGESFVERTSGADAGDTLGGAGGEDS